MQCMSKRDHLNKTQSKNFAKTSSIFKNPKKPKSKWMKWMIQERKKIIPDEEHKVWAENQVGYVKRLSEKCLGKRKEIFCWKKWRENRTKAIYRKHKTRWIESYRELSSTNSQQIYLSRCYRELSMAKKSRWIKQLLSIYWADRKFLDGSRICREAIETNSRKLRWIEIALTSVEKWQSKSSMDS